MAQVNEVTLASADATSGSGSVTSLSLTPTGYAVGDVLIAEFFTVGGSATHTETGAGTWTNVGDTGVINSVARLSVWRWRADSTGGTFTFDLGGTTRRATLSIRAFRNVDATTPIEGTPDVDGAGGQTSYTHAAQTAAGDGRAWVLCTGKNTVAGATTTLNNPGLYIETADLCSAHTTNANGNAGMHWASQDTGSTGTEVVNSADASSRTWVGISFLLKPTSTITANIGQVIELELSQSVSIAQPTVVPLGQAVETETAQAIVLNKVNLGQVTETETAQAVTLIKRVAIGQVVEAEQALSITARESAYPVIGVWRQRSGSTWRQDMDEAVDEFGEFQGHAAFYYGTGANPLGSAEEQWIADGGRLHVFWKPQAGGQTWANVASGMRDATIDAAALDIKARAPEQIWLTIHHEPENDTNLTAGSGMTPTDYKNMWQRVRNRFDAAGVTNVTWVMVYMNSHSNPSSRFSGPGQGMILLYPGDSLVDIVSQQDYLNCATDPDELANKWIEDLDFLAANAGTGRQWHLKPQAFTEWGFELGGDLNPCSAGGDRRTNRGEVADGIDAIRAILPTLGARRVVELRYFDARSDFLTDKPGVDALAFQALKDASEAGQGAPILVPLGQPLESESAQTITVSITSNNIIVPVNRVTETETAQTLAAIKQGSQTIALLQVVEAETAQAVTMTTQGPASRFAIALRAPSYTFRTRPYQTDFAVSTPERT